MVENIDEKTNPNNNTPAQLIGLVAGPIVAGLFLIFFDPDPQRPEVGRMAAVAALMAIWWLFEAVPLYVTALLPVFVFPLLGIMSGKTVSSQYFNWVIFLFLGGFLVALAMERWSLHRRIAINVLLVLGGNPYGIMLGFMVAAGFLSMWISNTASTMMMIPVIMAVVMKLEETSGKENVDRYSKGLLLGVAHAASIGGVATLVGTPPNPAFLKIFSIHFPNGPEISFAQWFAFACPISIVFIAFLWFYLSWSYKPTGPFLVDKEEFRKQHKALGPMKYEEKVVALVFTSLAILWLTRKDINFGLFVMPGWSRLLDNPGYFNDGATAIAMATILFLIPSKNEPGSRVLDWQAVNRLPWGIVLLFGGGFALAHGFKESGLSVWVGLQLDGVKVLHPFIVVACVCLLATFLTELTSNTATTQIMLPILASLSVAAQIDPLLIMIPATISHSFAFMLPVATPPNAIVFGVGRLTVMDMAKTGLVLNLFGALLLLIAAYVLLPVIFGVDPGVFPDWAGK
ncbi:MAG: SLC13 family permease [Nitrospinota bacterium]|nr:SLC13 family permease [Nitrospinota bacterium]